MHPISQGDVLQQVKLSSQFPIVVEAIASRQIVAQQAEELDLQIDTAELQKAADSFRLKNNLVTVEQTVAWLKQHGLSLDDLETLMHHTVLKANKDCLNSEQTQYSRIKTPKANGCRNSARSRPNSAMPSNKSSSIGRSSVDYPSASSRSAILTPEQQIEANLWI